MSKLVKLSDREIKNINAKNVWEFSVKIWNLVEPNFDKLSIPINPNDYTITSLDFDKIMNRAKELNLNQTQLFAIIIDKFPKIVSKKDFNESLW